jgi:4-diphosphocytidyl-2-C-methyl-D-erythritol kinase
MTRVRAFAKINLSLRVIGVLAGGDHELRTIFQSIALYDTLTIRRTRGPFWIVCDDPACPADSTNLVWRAAEAAWAASGRSGSPRNVGVTLTKQIPIAAGLGGGSSDAAAALRAFAKMWKVDARRLPDIAASLGADVPYFIEGGTVLGLGRGDVLYPLIDRPKAWVALVVPSFGVSTTDAYAWFDDDAATPPRGRDRWPDRHALREAQNDLESAVAKRHPEISQIASALRSAGASYAAMTGSGSTVFGLFDSKAAADRAATSLGKRERALSNIIITRTLSRAECRRLAAK